MYNYALLAMPNANWVTMVCHLQKVGPQGNTGVEESLTDSLAGCK